MLDAFGTTHTAFLVISSGFGWTFLRAWKRQLVQARICLNVLWQLCALTCQNSACSGPRVAVHALFGAARSTRTPFMPYL